MGCCASCFRAPLPPSSGGGQGNHRVKTYRRPKWKSEEPLTAEKLQAMREEFWDTEPEYGGNRVIWDALKAVSSSDMATARVIIESAGVIVAAEDMTIFYDERGSKYSLPVYAVCDPVNLAKPGKRSSSETKERPGSTMELPVMSR